jgi:hypothetical protein
LNLDPRSEAREKWTGRHWKLNYSHKGVREVPPQYL